MKTYVILLSNKFPATHMRAGEVTNFSSSYMNARAYEYCKENKHDMRLVENLRAYKIHTIRANYPLWERRIKEIQTGRACLSVRMWTGKPYRSKQRVLEELTANDGIGIQRLQFDKDGDGMPSLTLFNIDGELVDWRVLATNDGLSLEDWKEWFGGYDLSKPMAIIHFTKFRY